VVGPGGWELDRDAESAVWAGFDVERRVVCGGDRGDDREAESVPVAVVAAVWGEAAEGLQQPVDLAGRDVGPMLLMVSVVRCPRVRRVMLTRPWGTL
jgi:hypothetical protein